MVNVGLLGDVSAGKTTLLRLFVLYNNKKRISNIEGGIPCTLIKTDFSGESTLEEDIEIENKETKTIHPNRVYFREEETGLNHTLFAPGGDRERAVVRMGIITISRIAKQIVTVFSLDRSLKEQFNFFDSIRHFPKEIYVCFNKFDLAVDSANDLAYISDLKKKVTRYFNKRKVKVKDFFFTCAEADDRFADLNDNAARMILKIATENAVMAVS
jgi:hypothetical protein